MAIHVLYATCIHIILYIHKKRERLEFLSQPNLRFILTPTTYLRAICNTDIKHIRQKLKNRISSS